MSTKNRREKHKKELRRLILEQSVRLIAETGGKNFTIRLLAEKIEYSPRTIYLYFRNKAAILDAVAEKMFKKTVDRIAADDIPQLPVEEIFQIMIDRHIDNALKQPALYEAIITRINEGDHEAGEAENELTARIMDMLTRLPGEKFREQIHEAAEVFLTSLRGTAMMLIRRSGQDPVSKNSPENHISVYKKIILGGLL